MPGGGGGRRARRLAANLPGRHERVVSDALVVLLLPADGRAGKLSRLRSPLCRRYVLYFCACLAERTWRFGLPLVLAFMQGTSRPARDALPSPSPPARRRRSCLLTPPARLRSPRPAPAARRRVPGHRRAGLRLPAGLLPAGPRRGAAHGPGVPPLRPGRHGGPAGRRHRGLRPGGTRRQHQPAGAAHRERLVWAAACAVHAGAADGHRVGAGGGARLGDPAGRQGQLAGAGLQQRAPAPPRPRLRAARLAGLRVALHHRGAGHVGGGGHPAGRDLRPHAALLRVQGEAFLGRERSPLGVPRSRWCQTNCA